MKFLGMVNTWDDAFAQGLRLFERDEIDYAGVITLAEFGKDESWSGWPQMQFEEKITAEIPQALYSDANAFVLFTHVGITNGMPFWLFLIVCLKAGEELQMLVEPAKVS